MPGPNFKALGIVPEPVTAPPVVEDKKEAESGYPMPGAPLTPIKSKFPKANIPTPGPHPDRKLNPIQQALETQRLKEAEEKQIDPTLVPARPLDSLDDQVIMVPGEKNGQGGMAIEGPSIGVNTGDYSQRVKSPNISAPSGGPIPKEKTPDAAPVPAKEDDFWGNIAKFLGDAGNMALGGLGKVAEGASRGMSAAGGTIESNPFFVANKQEFEKGQQQRELEQQSKLQKSEQDYTVGKLLPTQTQQALKLYGGNLGEYLRQFPYLKNLLGSLTGGAGGLGGGVQSSTDALGDSLAAGDYSQILNPGATKNLQYDPAAAQALEMEKLRMALGMLPTPPSR